MTKEEFLKDLNAIDTYPLEWQEKLYQAMTNAFNGTVCMLELKRRAGVTEEQKWNSPELEIMYYQAKMRENAIKYEEKEQKYKKEVKITLLDWIYKYTKGMHR